MRQYIARRLIFGVMTAVLVSLLVFTLLRIAPGDVALAIAVQQSGGEASLVTEAQLEELRELLGLNAPLHVQYWDWMSGFLRGDWGRSLFTNRSVFEEYTKKLPVTLELVLMAETVAVLLGIPAGILMALKRDTWIDYVVRLISLAGLSVPAFWSATLFLVAGAYILNWNPPLGYAPPLKDPLTNIQQFIWPALMLGYISAATQSRMMRSTMLEVLRQDYIRTAHAKGLTAFVVTFRHALKNALIPVITVIGITMALGLGGSVVIERVFSLPGMGNYLVEGMQQRDYPVVQSLILVFSVVVVLINLLVDLAYGWLDPRIRYH